MSACAREEGLVIQEVDGETLVYDLHRHRAHSLNATASAVWMLCDGSRSASDLAEAASIRLDTRVDEDVVWLALERLQKAHLLKEKLPAHSRSITMSRRRLARHLGLAGGLSLLVPLVTSIAAPTPAEAATCRGNGAACTANGQCCSGVCGASGTGNCIGG